MIIFRKRLKKFYLVSKDPNLEKQIISPAVPNNSMVKEKVGDIKTPRISLYNTVGDAISSTYLGQKLRPGTRLYVYEAINIYSESLIGPVGLDKIPYFRLIQEWWYLRNCMVKFIAEIEIGKLLGTEEYKYGPRQLKAPLYRWEWTEIIPKYQEKFGPKLKKFSDSELDRLNDRQLERLANKVVSHRKKVRLERNKLRAAKENTIASTNLKPFLNPTVHDEATIRAYKNLNYKKALRSEESVLRKELINTIQNDNT